MNTAEDRGIHPQAVCHGTLRPISSEHKMVDTLQLQYMRNWPRPVMPRR
jgi:hypothetical protein